MKREMRWAVSGAVLLASAGTLHASGDIGCMPAWQLGSRDYVSCGNSALLAPGNDTRVNLFFLMRDRQPVPATGFAYPDATYGDAGLGRNFFSWSMLRDAFFPRPERQDDSREGSRCVSLISGTDAFGSALRNNRTVPVAEREGLMAARSSVGGACGTGGAGFVPPARITSAAGKEYLGYLQAADAFYSEQWAQAREGFARLRSSKDGWLAETVAYMTARTELNAAQATAFDDYGSFAADKVDQVALGRAKGGFEDYLRRYSKGRYAASAQGLVRRTLWLGGDAVGLARAYERLLAGVSSSPAAPDLIEEIDNKLLIGSEKKAIDAPLLLATVDLMMMRATYEGGPPPISAAEIAAQEGAFAGRADLYGFVAASHAFYVERNPARVLQLIPDDARRTAYGPLAFSRQVLRGMALATRGDRNEAGFWRELLGGAKGPYQRPLVELALAMNYERTGRLAEVFAAQSPIGESAIREILLMNVAGPELLRAQARASGRPQHERDLALFTLLHKQLTYGDYAGFQRDVALIPVDATSDGGLWDLRQQEKIPVGLFREAEWSDGYPCQALSATVGALARNTRDVKARLCLGEFYRLNGFDDFGGGMAPTRRQELGGTPTLFPGKPTPRGELYTQIIADPKAAASDKAYALYRAVNCYAPSGNNQCGGADVAQSQRRAWFQRLKREFASSPWAQQLRYYW